MISNYCEIEVILMSLLLKIAVIKKVYLIDVLQVVRIKITRGPRI